MLFILSVTNKPFMLTVVMLSVITLTVIMLSVVMLNVVAPNAYSKNFLRILYILTNALACLLLILLELSQKFCE